MKRLFFASPVFDGCLQEPVNGKARLGQPNFSPRDIF
jgi:hypothetical protein